MRCADVPTRVFRCLIDQQKSIGGVPNVNDVPKFVPHLIRTPCSMKIKDVVKLYSPLQEQ
jgi:hypothetical protein